MPFPRLWLLIALTCCFQMTWCLADVETSATIKAALSSLNRPRHILNIDLVAISGCFLCHCLLPVKGSAPVVGVCLAPNMSSSNLFYKHKQFHIQNIYHFFDMFNEYLMLLKWSIFSFDTWSFYHKDSGVYVPFCTVIVPSVVLKVDTGTEICKKEKKSKYNVEKT